MGVRFVIGRAGSGKSLRCFGRIVEMMRREPLGPPIYWIVPKQETFSAERELTCGSGLEGFCRTRVVSFELLGEEILAECGGTAIPRVTALGRQMIIAHLLGKYQADMKYYASAARRAGLAAELDAAFAEFERCGRSIEDLNESIRDIQAAYAGDEESAMSLLAKLHDLRLLYEHYLAYLGQERLDPQRRLAQVLASLAGCRRIQQSHIYVDGFFDLVDYERQMLAGLAKVCREMEITLLMDPASPVVRDPHRMPDEMGLFFRTEDTYRRLWFALSQAEVALDEPVRLEECARFESACLQQVERHAFSDRPVICEAVQDIEMIEAPDRRGEVDAAARHIRKLLETGMRLRDIVVLMRDVDDYHELIDAAFREHGIRYFVDRRRTAAHHPLIGFTRALLQIVLHDWPHDAAMTLLKTELAGLTHQQVDEMENYVLLHRIRGAAWTQPWRYRRKLTRQSQDQPPAPERIDLERIDAMRRGLADRIAPLARVMGTTDAIPLRSLVVGLFETFERFGVRKTLREWIDQAAQTNSLEQAGEHEQVWAELVELLDQMTDVLGSELVSPADFVDLLETGLERFDLALTPPTVDEVLVGAVDRTRSSRPRAVVLLGMNDGQFPRVSKEGSILSDEERKTLKQHRMELDPDTERKLLDERLLGYIGLTRASKHLCLMRAIADEQGRPQFPSAFWVHLREQFPSLLPAQVPRQSFGMDCIGTPRQLVTALMQWVRNQPRTTQDSWASLYHWLATHACCNDAIDTMRYRAWRALSYRNEAKLENQTAARMFGSPLGASVSRIETFAACPFRHFLQYGLKLAQREAEEVTAIDLGNICHGILEQIVRRMVKANAGWEAMPPDSRAEMIREAAAQIGQEMRGELMLSSARNQYILNRIERTVDRVMAAQTAAGRRGELAPWRVELGFGIKGSELGPLTLKTPGGHEVNLYGKIDRVDRVQDQAAFAVIDYKLSGHRLALDDVYHGLSLQLLTYLLVLQRCGKQLAGRKLTPVAAFYVRILRQLENVDHPDEATPPDDPTFDLKIKPRGIVDWNHRAMIDADLSNRSEVAQLYAKTDGSIGNKNTTDAVESEEFAAMLRLAEHKLVELSDQIISGTVDVAPYRKGQASPCAHCEYHSVCRFDAALNQYRPLVSMKRQAVLEMALREHRDGA